MSGPLRQIRAIVRAYEAEFGQGAVAREAFAMLLGAATFAVFVFDLVALSAVLGTGR